MDQTNTEKHCKEYAQNYRVLLTIFTIKPRLIHPIKPKKSIYLRFILGKYHKIEYPTIQHSKIRFSTNKNMDIHSDVHGQDKEIPHIFPVRFFHTNPEHTKSFLLQTVKATPVFSIYAITIRTIAVISGPSAKLFRSKGDLNYHGQPPFCIFFAVRAVPTQKALSPKTPEKLPHCQHYRLQWFVALRKRTFNCFL